MDEGIGPFAQQQLIRQVHQMIFHVFTQPGNELESLFEEQLVRGAEM